MKPCRVRSFGGMMLGAILALAACESGRQFPGVTYPTTPPVTSSSITLSGQVVEVTAAGTFPLAGATVSAWVIPGSRHFNTAAGPDGRYSFSQLPRGSYVVRASSPGRRQLCGALLALTANTRLDLEVTSSVTPERSPNPAPITVTGQIYEVTPAGRIGLGGAVIYVYWANDGFFMTVIADANGYYQACGIPVDRAMAFEVVRDLFAGYNGEYETPYDWHEFSANATLDIELKRRPADK